MMNITQCPFRMEITPSVMFSEEVPAKDAQGTLSAM